MFNVRISPISPGSPWLARPPPSGTESSAAPNRVMSICSPMKVTMRDEGHPSGSLSYQLAVWCLVRRAYEAIRHETKRLYELKGAECRVPPSPRKYSIRLRIHKITLSDQVIPHANQCVPPATGGLVSHRGHLADGVLPRRVRGFPVGVDLMAIDPIHRRKGRAR